MQPLVQHLQRTDHAHVRLRMHTSLDRILDMIHTSVLLNNELHAWLKAKSEQEKASVSEVLNKVLEHSMEVERNERSKHVAAAFKKFIGSLKNNDARLSQNMDEFLYGESGAWKAGIDENGK